MTIYQQNGQSSNTLNRRSLLSPPPSYDSIIKENDDDQKITETTDPFSDVQKIIGDTYSILYDLQTRLTRIENTNDSLASNLKIWTQQHNRNGDSSRQNEIEGNTDDNKTLDTMTLTVQQLLEEANTSLNSNNTHLTTLLEDSENEDFSEETVLYLDHMLQYETSEQSLDFAFNQLLHTVDDYNMISTLSSISTLPITRSVNMFDINNNMDNNNNNNNNNMGDQPIEQHIHHTYHHYHYHYHASSSSSSTILSPPPPPSSSFLSPYSRQQQQQQQQNNKDEFIQRENYYYKEISPQINDTNDTMSSTSTDDHQVNTINSSINSKPQIFMSFLQRFTTNKINNPIQQNKNHHQRKYRRTQLYRFSLKMIILCHFILIKYKYRSFNLMKYRWRGHYYRLIGSSNLSFIRSYHHKVIFILFTIRFIRHL